jgi:2',3'-cyclic-nucleotide 2'-phosphodiesterase (5'-nucleotidase family)
MMDGYEFREAHLEARDQVLHLQNEGVDFIIVAIHGENQFINNQLSQLNIDLILNAHTHRPINQTINNIPVIQTAPHARAVAQLIFNYQNGSLRPTVLNHNINNDPRLLIDCPKLLATIDEYFRIIEPLLTQVINHANRNISSLEITRFVSQVMAVYAETQFGFHNDGGTRATLRANQPITVALIHTILPFDNELVTFKLQGRLLRNWMENPSLSDGRNGFASIPISEITDQGMYSVATTDFILGRASWRNEVEDLQIHGTLLYEFLLIAVRQQADNDFRFDTNNVFVLPNPASFLVVINDAKQRLNYY